MLVLLTGAESELLLSLVGTVGTDIVLSCGSDGRICGELFGLLENGVSKLLLDTTGR